ncbi:hypothetical protein AMECASPLE_037192 [Ameca splendens]|uniref:Secreted protein n=1 Tax=Ameca splendens TaxID=208324 RepID=A0ABV0XXB1_9TELE
MSRRFFGMWVSASLQRANYQDGAASELRSVFVYFVRLYVFGATILWSHSVERTFSTSESSLGIFSPSFIDLRFTELLASGAAALYGILWQANCATKCHFHHASG